MSVQQVRDILREVEVMSTVADELGKRAKGASTPVEAKAYRRAAAAVKREIETVVAAPGSSKSKKVVPATQPMLAQGTPPVMTVDPAVQPADTDIHISIPSADGGPETMCGKQGRINTMRAAELNEETFKKVTCITCRHQLLGDTAHLPFTSGELVHKDGNLEYSSAAAAQRDVDLGLKNLTKQLRAGE